jgi:hypothetical protein
MRPVLYTIDPPLLLVRPYLKADQLLFSLTLFVTLQLFQAKSAIGFCPLGGSFLSCDGFLFLLLTFSLCAALFFALQTPPTMQLVL